MSFAQRREKLRELMSARSLDAMLVSYASNRYYLSGFELHDVQLNESAGSLVITRDGRDYLCTDARYTDAARAIWPENDIYIYSGSIPQALRRLLSCCGSRIGFEAGSVSAAFAKELSEGLTLEPCDGMVEELRLIKEPEEIASLEKSFAVNHAMLKWIKGEIREGMTEAEVSWMIERYFREHGASELAFPSIVAFGENGALPHAIPGEKKLKENMSVLLDVGCRVDTYCSDQTRTFWFGEKEDPKFTRIRDLVQEAQSNAIKHMHPGMPMSDAYNLAMDVFRKAGEDAHFTHSLGHGVGLDTHEKPSLSPRSKGILKPGMTVTVEPGLYYPGWGGVRLEFTTIMEENGPRIL